MAQGLAGKLEMQEGWRTNQVVKAVGTKTPETPAVPNTSLTTSPAVKMKKEDHTGKAGIKKEKGKLAG